MNESNLQLGTSILLPSEDKTSLLARQIADSSSTSTTILLYGETAGLCGLRSGKRGFWK